MTSNGNPSEVQRGTSEKPRRRPSSARVNNNIELKVTSTSPLTTHQSPSAAALSSRIISGSVGSLVTALVVTPLEVVKVHLQNAKPTTSTGTSIAPHISSSSVSAASIPPNVSPCPKGCGTFVLNNGLFDCVLPKCSVPYFDQYGNLRYASVESAQAAVKHQTSRSVGTFEAFRTIFVKEGFRGIYAGLAPTLVMGVPSTVFYYAVYDEIIARAKRNEHIPAAGQAWTPLVAGSSARLLSTMVTAPLELIRTRQASMVGQGQEMRGMVEEFQLIVRNEGCRSLYNGLGPTLLRDVPFSGVYWLGLEKFRGLYGPLFVQEIENPTSLQKAGIAFLSGASAGMVAAACTTPFDVVKTRQQSVTETVDAVVRRPHAIAEACCDHAGHVVYQSETAAASPPSVFASMRSIYEAEGVRGLWRGNQARMIKVAPSCAIMITAYEAGKRILESEPI